jgi:AraC-like DNA-binding protein
VQPDPRVDHATIVTEDLESARRFLCAIVGLSEGPRPPFSVDGHWLYANGQPIIHLIEKPAASSAISGSRRTDHVGLRGNPVQEWSMLLDRARVNSVPHGPGEGSPRDKPQLFVCAGRLTQNHVGPPPAEALLRATQEGLDRRRLSRVLDYIEGNLEGDLTLDQLAGIACLSRFHFARAFKAAIGQSPHQHVSARRLERAKELLTRGNQSLIDITLTLNFSCQANFTRAFRQATGLTPGLYRRSFRVGNEDHHSSIAESLEGPDR